MQMGDYRLDHLVGFDMEKVGIIGTGKIGALCKIMHGFGCKILACDQSKIRN
jgi:D-lactate dehydrogenase